VAFLLAAWSKKFPQKDRSRSAYVTEVCHLDPNPVINEIKAFLLIDPPAAELVQA
jgi:hypothetical protein